jgi:hypothetical protein
MPPNYYTLIPGSRNLTESEIQELIRGLVATFE